MYTPETEWNQNGNLIYNLKQEGSMYGTPVMVNDVAVVVHAPYLSEEDRQEVMHVILSALNRRFVKE